MSERKVKPLPMIGVGSPGILRLEQFGEVLNDAFGATAYLVGSSARGKVWRDVDADVYVSKTAAAMDRAAAAMEEAIGG